MSDAPPATHDEAYDALMKKEEYRAPSLDGYAQTYQAALSLRACLDQYAEQSRAPVDDPTAEHLIEEVDAYLGAMREHVAETEPVAVRETLERVHGPRL